jgi:hypothetical protein
MQLYRASQGVSSGVQAPAQLAYLQLTYDEMSRETEEKKRRSQNIAQNASASAAVMFVTVSRAQTFARGMLLCLPAIFISIDTLQGVQHVPVQHYMPQDLFVTFTNVTYEKIVHSHNHSICTFLTHPVITFTGLAIPRETLHTHV